MVDGNQQRDTVYLFTGSPATDPLYAPWINELELPTREIDQLPIGEDVPSDMSLIVTHRQYQYEDVAGLRHAMEQGVAVLVLADGILEYRNSWENPNLANGAIFRPVVGHKLACIGNSQARLVASWGNPGACEVVGLPRLDRVQNSPSSRLHDSNEAVKLMVLTAKTPGFTPDQLEISRRSLADVRDFFASRDQIDGHPFEVAWRISPQLADEIGIENTQFDPLNNDLVGLLADYDAVLTTPSTTALEAMLQSCPVGLLDYHNAPHYVPAVWTISCREQIESVVTELITPPSPKIDFQNAILRDSLECTTPAAPRLIKLVRRMDEIARQCRSRNEPLVFPDRILEATQISVVASNGNADQPDTTALRNELEYAAIAHRRVTQEADALRQEVRELSQETHQVKSLLNKVEEQLRRTEQREQEARSEIEKKNERIEETRANNERLLRQIKTLEGRIENLLDSGKTKLDKLKQKQLQIDELHIKLKKSHRENEDMAEQLGSIRKHWLIGNLLRCNPAVGSPSRESSAEPQAPNSSVD